jgi:hypothetical protein
MTISEDVKDVAIKISRSLPAQFLGLLLINTVFLLAFTWFIHDAAIERIKGVTTIVSSCTEALARK